MSAALGISDRSIGIRARPLAFFTSSRKTERFAHDETGLKQADCTHLCFLLSDLLVSIPFPP
jgi:hypothetical protein